MPIPVPNPTPRELVKMSKIFELDIEATGVLLASDSDQEISNARWAEALELLESYAQASGDAGDVKRIDDIEFFENKAAPQAFRLKNEIRALYGLPEIESSYGIPAHSCSVDVQFEF